MEWKVDARASSQTPLELVDDGASFGVAWLYQRLELGVRATLRVIQPTWRRRAHALAQTGDTGKSNELPYQIERMKAEVLPVNSAADAVRESTAAQARVFGARGRQSPPPTLSVGGKQRVCALPS